MAIDDNGAEITYSITSSSTGPFPVPFEFENNADLLVYLYAPGAVPGDADLLVLDDDYSVTGAGDNDGGTLTLLAAAENQSLLISRNTALERLTDFPLSGPLSMIALNREFDRRVLADQETRRDLDRALLVPPGELAQLLPAQGTRAGRAFRWDLDGNPTVGDDEGNPLPFADLPFASYVSKAAVEAATVSTSYTCIYIAGYSVPGDGGGAFYRKAVSEPAHDLKIQSDDGAWWEISENIIKPQMAGADPTGTTDSTTAINAVLEYIRQIVYAPTFLSPTTVLARRHYMDGAGGVFRVNGSINAVAIVLGRNWGIRNLVINAHCTNKVVLDLTGSRFGHFSDIHIWGDETDTPWSGIQLAIEDDGAGSSNPCTHHNFTNVTVDGYFFNSAFHNYAAEQIFASHCMFWNRKVALGGSSGNSYAAIFDGSQEKTARSDFTTFPAAGRSSFTVNQYVHCAFQKPFGISGPTMFIQDIANFRFDNCYITNGSGTCIEWRMTATFNSYSVTMDFQIETTGNQSFIEFRTDVVAGQRQIDRLSCRFGNVFSADQVFKVNSALNKITLTDFECKIPHWAAAAPTNKVFDTPSKVSLSNAAIMVPAVADMNDPSTLVAFDGVISDATGVSQRYFNIRSYTVATLPSASPLGQLVYVSDGTANKRLGVSTGAGWRFPDGAVVS